MADSSRRSRLSGPSWARQSTVLAGTSVATSTPSPTAYAAVRAELAEAATARGPTVFDCGQQAQPERRTALRAARVPASGRGRRRPPDDDRVAPPAAWWTLSRQPPRPRRSVRDDVTTWRRGTVFSGRGRI